uniref:MOR2-PAG1_C domain-containing protein n=1 Tax=Echinostoma caproni TaxID=27848 RepID=A0A183BBN2_9TREM
LLPLVHKIWPSLMARFRDRFAIVVEKAFQFLVVLSNVARDFLRSRASSDIIPSLVTFLKRGLPVSANSTESYRHLTSYRVQHELLARLGTFCSDLNLGTESLRPVVRLCALYLATNQPPGLRQATFQSVKVFWLLDPGLVWFELLSRLPHRDLVDVLPSPPNSARFSQLQAVPPRETVSCKDRPPGAVMAARIRDPQGQVAGEIARIRFRLYL